MAKTINHGAQPHVYNKHSSRFRAVTFPTKLAYQAQAYAHTNPVIYGVYLQSKAWAKVPPGQYGSGFRARRGGEEREEKIKGVGEITVNINYLYFNRHIRKPATYFFGLVRGCTS